MLTPPRRLAPLRLLLALAFATGAAHASSLDARRAEPPRESYGEEITVAIDTLTVRVVDPSGQPILGLTPDDFQVQVHGKEIPITAVDWISSQVPDPAAVELATPEGDPAPRPATSPEDGAAGKLVVLFVQADLTPSRISGQLRLRPHTRELLATLAPADRVAVVSFDSHLKLWLDFTPDREAVLTAVDRAMLFTPEDKVIPSPAPSLATEFDGGQARRAASPEKALEVTARALALLPGEKTMIYLGWGLGRFGGGGVQMTPDYSRAVKALSRARISVFVLDVTSADFHSLELGLQAVAAATGGTYASTYRLPARATARLARAISGWYVLTFDREALAGIPAGEAVIHLRGRSGEVLARTVVLR